MKLEFKDIIDSHKGEVGIVLGLGGSAKNHLDIIKKSDCVKISCNNVDKKAGVRPDYWVIANNTPELTIAKKHRDLFASEATVIYAETVDTDRYAAGYLYGLDYIAFDQRHFKGKQCSPKGRCCEKIKNRLTIQEELKKYTKCSKHYGTGNTVAVHMLAVGILIGLKKIYLYGVDLDYSTKYIDGSTPQDQETAKDLKLYIEENLKDFEIIKRSAKKVGCEIKNFSKGRLNEIF